MRVLSGFTPNLEIYSIDEAFLGLSGFEARLEAHARELRRTVLQWTGIPVSVGIAPTKTLAKVANRLAKRDAAGGGVRCLLDEASQREALARLELTDLWGIAGRLAARLNAIGITNCMMPITGLSASASALSSNAWCWSCEALHVSASKKSPQIGKA